MKRILNNDSNNKGGKILLLIFLMICSGLGIAAFTMSFTKKCGEGFEQPIPCDYPCPTPVPPPTGWLPAAKSSCWLFPSPSGSSPSGSSPSGNKQCCGSLTEVTWKCDHPKPFDCKKECCIKNCLLPVTSKSGTTTDNIRCKACGDMYANSPSLNISDFDTCQVSNPCPPSEAPVFPKYTCIRGKYGSYCQAGVKGDHNTFQDCVKNCLPPSTAYL